jgi:redox-sensitive bicupin YhaK (pirin superfamily)
VQWMTSGRGILHEEMPRRGPDGTIMGFQLWVNLPAALKMGQPRYQEVNAAAIPTVEQAGVKVHLVAGEYQHTHGAVTEIAARPLYMDVTLAPGVEFCQPVPLGHTAIAYLFEGAAWFGLDDAGAGERVQAVHMLEFGDGDQLRVRAATDSSARFMLMAGAPFNEPIVPYGPFVMNTQEEIRQALADLQNGTFVQN